MTTVTAEETIAVPAQARAQLFYVIVTDRITSPCVLVRTPDWTLVIIRTGVRAGDLGPTFAKLTPDERRAWCIPWGVNPRECVWDTVPPETIIGPEQIKPPHVAPPRVHQAAAAYFDY